jgi:uncharacterized RDD family membrane protein YckC/DNA-binding transcriptional regulator YdaS (Cro superfamily)
LGVGARGADRVAQATGVNQALDQAVEEAIVRALRSPGVRRAIERAIETEISSGELTPDAIREAARRALDSEAATQVWAEVLSSDQVQMLVERIAEAPEIRAAIAAQTSGLITDIGIRLTKITEALDDAMERVTRRDSDSETNQAGLATRLVAAAVDLGLFVGAYSLASAALAALLPYTFGGGHLSVPLAIVLGVLGVLLAGAIIVAFWSLVGQTPGMRFLAIRVTDEGGGGHIAPRTAIRRLLGVIVSLVPLGLGFLAILRDPKRRAWHDRMTGTEVVYDMTRRTAPHSVRSDAPRPAAT